MTWLRAARVHQWAKNLLLLLPAGAAHLQPTPGVLAALAAGFASFSLLASAVYLVNDLVDLEADRAHPVKRHRPLASGDVSPGAQGAAALALGVSSAALAFTLPPPFVAAWGAYLVLTTLYSFALKRMVVLDVVVLAALYTLRVVAGAAAVTVPLTRWFLAFSVFLFCSLALLKRMVEARTAGADVRRTTDARPAHRLRGRGWEVRDVPVLLGFGVGSAVAAALVYCLYITGDDVLRLYGRPDVLWLGLPVILYSLARLWLLANRGEVDDDPVVFALRDPATWGVVAAMAAVVWGAT